MDLSFSARKQALRRTIIERVQALDPVHRAVEEAALLGRLAALPGLLEARTVLLHVSAFPEEFATRPLLEQTLGRGQILLCPRVDRPGRCLRLHRVEHLETDFIRGSLGIPEPRKTCPTFDPALVDWVLVPGLAFDARCNRLGRGAGYYDRLLPTLRPDAPRWALILESQWVLDVPVEPHDVPLDGVASASRLVRRERV
ncbi:MAG: 5-formyltetrahydrofolate cyclo-ligase [Isosphaeraceae bacterium]